MSQNTLVLPTTGTLSGLAAVTDVNAANDSMNSMNSGGTAPTNMASGTPVAGNAWLDTSSSPYKMKIYDGSNWLIVGYLDSTNHLTLPIFGGGTASVASAATVDLGASPQTLITITGTTTITSFGSTATAGQARFLKFSGALTLTNNATSLILPTGANITTAAGDTAVAVALGSGNWLVVNYLRASGLALAAASGYPTGATIYFASTSAPSGFLVCDGSAVSRTTYATLFGITSTTFGAGDGSTTFNLPDLRGVYIRGYDNGRGLDSGRVFGTYQADSYASHTHTVSDPGHSHSKSDPGHGHTLSPSTAATVTTYVAAYSASGGSSPNVASTGISAASAVTGISYAAAATGITNASSGSTETRGKNLALLGCIKY